MSSELIPQTEAAAMLVLVDQACLDAEIMVIDEESYMEAASKRNEIRAVAKKVEENVVAKIKNWLSK